MAKARPTTATPPGEPDEATSHAHASGETAKAIVTHILGLLTLFLGPLLLYFAFRGKASPWLRAHLAGSTNDGVLTFALLVVVVVALAFLASFGGIVTVLAILLLVLVLLHVAGRVLALVQSVKGTPFHIPLCPRLLR